VRAFGAPENINAQEWTQISLDASETLELTPKANSILQSAFLSLHAVKRPSLACLLQIRQGGLKPDRGFSWRRFSAATRCANCAESLAAGEKRNPRRFYHLASRRFADVPRFWAGLLQRAAGFTLPVADIERTVVRLSRRFTTLINDLRAAGETNAPRANARRHPSQPAVLTATAAHYAPAAHAEPDGRLRATFDVVYP